MGASGNVTADYGSTPVAETSVAVTGQGAILASSQAEAWIMGAMIAGGSGNDQNAHLLAGAVVRCTCGIPVVGVGFTIFLDNTAFLATGQFSVQWVWN